MERTRPGSRHGGVDSSADAHRRRRRVTGPGRGEDLFLEMAKDSPVKQDRSSIASQAGSPEQSREVNPRYQQCSRPKASTKAPLSMKQYPSTLSLHSQSSPNPPNTAPPVSGQRYFRTHLTPALASGTRGASAGEMNASMRPFKPTPRPSQLSALAFGSPRSIDSGSSYQTTDPSPATPSCADGVDSVGSVTAASTIWDEAEELNAKLKQYRSGRRIRSNGEQPDERPRTSTTMTTTASTRSSALRQALTADGNAKHQLLRTALQRLQGKVDHEVYRQLESSVADGISASTVLAVKREAGADDAASTFGTGLDDRQLRRKIDSLCQSLTDLCIALGIRQAEASATLVESPALERPRTRGSDGNDSPMSYLDQRRARIGSSSRAPSRISENPEPETQTSVRSYLANRSAANGTSDLRAGSLSPEQEYSPTTYLHPNMPSHSTASLYRTATSTAASDSQDAGSSDRVSTIRAPSHAATEALSRPSAGGGSAALRERNDRTFPENSYKSSADHVNHLCAPTTLSPSAQKTLATNHSNVSLNSAYSAATYAGETRGASAANKLLQDRLERKRREMVRSRTGVGGQSSNNFAPGSADIGQRSRGASCAASTADFSCRPRSRGFGY